MQYVCTGNPLTVLFDLVKSSSLDVKGCSPEDLSAKSKQGDTLLIAAVRGKNSALVKDLLEKGLPQDIKDYRDTEVRIIALFMTSFCTVTDYTFFGCVSFFFIVETNCSYPCCLPKLLQMPASTSQVNPISYNI